MAQEKIVQTAGRTQLSEFAPKFAELNDDVLFGEVWSRTDKLGLRDRSLVTVTSLISQGITDNSLVFHLQSAKKNGITRTEIAEIITHIGFYAGWPKAWAAFNLAKGVWAEDATGEDAKATFQREMLFPIGEPNTAYAEYFIGNSYLAPVSREQVSVSNVTFEPRCRNNWHIHRATKGGGQMLIGVAGRGWYQEEAIAVFGSDPRIYKTTVKEFVKDADGKLCGLICVKLESKKDEATGRMMMVPVEGSEFALEAELARAGSTRASW